MKGLLPASTGTRRAASKAVLSIGLLVALFLGAYLYSGLLPLQRWKIASALGRISHERGVQEQQALDDESHLPCRKIPGAEDVLIVMRTGATEIKDKLPVHFETTFRCYGDFILLSDYEEEFQGHQVHDLLADIDDEVKEKHPDFELYRRLQAYGRQSLNESELSGAVSSSSGQVGKNDNDGWRLDKWKFLPMAVKTLELRREKKWYVFVEPDTYLVWSNLLDWLQRLDHNAPSYYGSEVQIGDDIFAHGGSAFVLSNPALHLAASQYQEKPKPWHDLTSIHWAGDCILGKALNESGVPLTWAWPMFQGGNPATMDFLESKPDERNLWCSPAISYHHLSPAEIEHMFLFEQDWLRTSLSRRQQPLTLAWRTQEQLRLHHSDVYQHYVLPNVTVERHNWTNGSPELREDVGMDATLDDCRAVCAADDKCVQYAHSVLGCSFSRQGKMGQPTVGVQAGWLEDRMRAWGEAHEVCGERDRGWAVT